MSLRKIEKSDVFIINTRKKVFIIRFTDQEVKLKKKRSLASRVVE